MPRFVRLFKQCLHCKLHSQKRLVSLCVTFLVFVDTNVHKLTAIGGTDAKGHAV
jgi:hypothetical protein